MGVSIFIRAYNEAAWIGKCLEMIARQKTSRSTRVIVLDSGSGDETAELARRQQAEVYVIPKAAFSYSAALNFGVSIASGELFVSLSAHAIPVDETWLDNLLAPLENPSIVGSFSGQVAPAEASEPEAMALARVFPPEPRVYDRASCLAGNGRGLMEPPFSNVSSCIRLAVARRYPFRDTYFSEDRLFAMECIYDGHAIAYAPTSRVYHLHPPSCKESSQIAFRATRARHEIGLFVKSKEQKMRLDSPGLGLGLSCLKLTAFPLWFLVMWGKCLMKAAKSSRKREVRFYLATVGTLLGKICGYWQILLGKVQRLPGAADPAPIAALARRIE